MKKTTIIPGFLIALLITVGGLAVLFSNRALVITPVDAAETQRAVALLTQSLESPHVMYVDFLHTHQDTPAGTDALAVKPVAEADTLSLYDSAEYTVNVPAAGLYRIQAQAELWDETIISPILQVFINGETPYQDAHAVTVPLLWADATKDFPIDSYGDETLPSLISLRDGPFTFDFYGSNYTSDTPLLFYFAEGENTLAIKNLSSTRLTLSALTLLPPETPESYEAYLARHANAPLGQFQSAEAEDYLSKNNTLIQLFPEKNPSVNPASAVDKRMNSVDIGMEPGQEITLSVNAPTDGLYHIALHVRAGHDDFPAFFTLRINGALPFAECLSYPIPARSGSNWYNVILGGEDDPYWFYLTQGTHEISLRAENAPVARAMRNLQLMVDHINYFNLEILKITGKDIDRNRTWMFTRYIPESVAYLEAYDILLRDIMTTLAPYSTRAEKSAKLSGVSQALALLENIREFPDDLPLNLDALSGTSGSVLQLAGDQLDTLINMGIGVDALYLFTDPKSLPPGSATLAQSFDMMLQQLAASYFSPKYSAMNQPEDLNIWVRRSLVEIDMIQKMVDVRFNEPGMPKINLSVMPDENTLVLAAAAGNQPDVAMGVPSHIPFDLSVRDALYDLTSFPDFWEIAGRIPLGGLVPFVFNERVYAFPETVNFYALAYREDIFRSLGLEPPDTWQDVCDMMPTLQRYGMSFYHPIANADTYKWFHQTTPLVLQNGGTLFSQDGLRSTINDPGAVKGLTLMADLFTMYSLETQVPVFSSAFRTGSIPVGIVDRSDYIMLKYAAPEIAGQWKLADYPGTVQEDGSVSRWFVQAAESVFIFKDTEKADYAWEFLKWWTDAPAQKEYAVNIRSTYGPGMLVLSSNLEALADAPIDEEDKRVILNQMAWMTAVPRTPGQYMLERTLSDIWNDSVFMGVPTRIAIDKRMMSIQREMRRKMTEFGFLDAEGNPLQPYAVRDVEWLIAEQAAKGGTK